MSPRPHPNASGFTLIEVVVAIVLLAVASTAIISLNGQLFQQSAYMRSLQQATQVQQACVELVLAQRKSAGYAATLDCSTLNNLISGITLSVANAASVQYCPTGLTCKQVEVSVSAPGISIKPATLLLVNY